MHMLDFKVYYDENLFKDDSSRYYLLATGTVPGIVDDVIYSLSDIFTFFNGIPQENVLLTNGLIGIPRSMSVGDVVVIGENAWLCDTVGWTDFDVSSLPRESMYG